MFVVVFSSFVPYESTPSAPKAPFRLKTEKPKNNKEAMRNERELMRGSGERATEISL